MNAKKPDDLSPLADTKSKKKKRNTFYDKEMRHLHIELIELQEWIKATGQKLVVIFEGRDAAGKGGAIKRISEPLNPRVCRMVALGTPTEREKPTGISSATRRRCRRPVKWFRSTAPGTTAPGSSGLWAFAPMTNTTSFFRSCPEFERMLVRSSITVIKYWFSVSDEEQERRFAARVEDPTKRWKLSPMDLESRNRWQDYSGAKDDMLAHTDIEQAPWFVVNSDNKKRARLNCISHLLSQLA